VALVDGDGPAAVMNFGFADAGNRVPVDDSEAIAVGQGRYSGETIIATAKGIRIFGLEFEKKN
jgi:hypothetical protein